MSDASFPPCPRCGGTGGACIEAPVLLDAGASRAVWAEADVVYCPCGEAYLAGPPRPAVTIHDLPEPPSTAEGAP